MAQLLYDKIKLPPKAISKYEPIKGIIKPRKIWHDNYHDSYKDALRYYNELLYLPPPSPLDLEPVKLEVKVTLSKWKAMESYDFIFDGRVQIKIPEEGLSKEALKIVLDKMKKDFEAEIIRQFKDFTSMDLDNG